MNAERLHAIAREVRNDYQDTELPQTFEQLNAALAALAQNPADPTSSQQAASLRLPVQERLAASRTNTFSDAWRLTLEELGIWELTGDRLRDRVEEIFLRNEITPSTAASEVGAINTEIQGLWTSLENIVSAFDALGVEAEDLAPGEFEVGFLIPREAVASNLERLGEEFEELDQTLGPFMELAGEGRPDIEVRTISSSAFQVFLLASPGLALTMAKVVESLLSSYEKIKSIRDKATDLEEAGVPSEAMEALLAHANERMEIDIDALANELVGQAAARFPEGGREYELKVEVKHSLRRLATRIDEGYSIEVRAFSPEDVEAGETEGMTTEAVNAAREITERQPRMRRMNLTGRPILELPEGDDDATPQEPPLNSPDTG